MCGFSKQGVTTVLTLISLSGLFNDCHSQGWEWPEYLLDSFMLSCSRSCPANLPHPSRKTMPHPCKAKRRPVLAVEKQPHSLVLRSGTPKVNTASGELLPLFLLLGTTC